MAKYNPSLEVQLAFSHQVLDTIQVYNPTTIILMRNISENGLDEAIYSDDGTPSRVREIVSDKLLVDVMQGAVDLLEARHD